MLCLVTHLFLTPNGRAANVASSAGAIRELKQALQDQEDHQNIDWQALEQASLAQVALTREDTQEAVKLLSEAYQRTTRLQRSSEMKEGLLRAGDHVMPFSYKVFGDLPKEGRSLFISMHGGGGAPARVNDQQWENQKGLYQPKEGVYLTPRAPTNTWNLWHQDHIDGMFRRLIENMVLFESVNPDKVYLMGYSAGGDGVYQLAPRMADSFAAASMMAGHPNETSPIGLRNLPFALFMGGKDTAYQRNTIASEWKEKLEALQEQDPGGYTHWVKIFPEYGHWMQKEDAVALDWMQAYRRVKYPQKIVWKQDDVMHQRFYWLKASPEAFEPRGEVVVRQEGQTIIIERMQVTSLTFRFNDQMLDLDQEVTIRDGDRELHRGKIQRSLGVLIGSLLERGDPSYLFAAALTVNANP